MFFSSYNSFILLKNWFLFFLSLLVFFKYATRKTFCVTYKKNNNLTFIFPGIVFDSLYLKCFRCLRCMAYVDKMWLFIGVWPEFLQEKIFIIKNVVKFFKSYANISPINSQYRHSRGVTQGTYSLVLMALVVVFCCIFLSLIFLQQDILLISQIYDITMKHLRQILK